LSEQLKINSGQIVELIKAIQALNLDDLEKIEDIGPVVAESIYDWWHDKKNISLLRKMADAGVEFIPVISKKSAKLMGKIFVLTGALSSLTRGEAKDRIRELGGDTSSAVSKNTDYLVAGEEPGSKYKKALKLKIKIINEKQFTKML